MELRDSWPELHWQDWHETADTLHMYLQVLGKIQLSLSPRLAQWQQASLRVTGRGICSQTMDSVRGALTIEFDLRRHEVVFDSSDGQHETRPLDGCTVAVFWKNALTILDGMGIQVDLNPLQQEVPNPLRCDTDSVHRGYDPDAAHRFYQVLTDVHQVFQTYRGDFAGKQTETAFWWGTFDLGVTRFSGAPADPPPGAGLIYRVAMDAAQHEIGFWPGDDSSPEPVFYAYTYPPPVGIQTAPVGPAAARWAQYKGEFVLPYEAVRTSDDPTSAVLEFARSTYQAGASLSGWDLEALARGPGATPGA
jgi:hypothetical protein